MDLDNRTPREAGEALVCQCVLVREVVIDGCFWNISEPGEWVQNGMRNIVRIKCDPKTADALGEDLLDFLRENKLHPSSWSRQHRDCGGVPPSVMVELSNFRLEDIILYLKYLFNEE